MNTITKIDWPSVIGDEKDLWRQAYARLGEDSEEYHWVLKLGAHFLWMLGLPQTIIDESYEVADYLGVDPLHVMAAQVVYDEGWHGASDFPGHGCTSVSSNAGFGRNMDYAYPENASDYIYHTEVEVGGVTLMIEGFAGLLGWLAYRGDSSAASFNQAPALRRLRRSKMPAMAWFREHSLQLEKMSSEDLPREGDIWAPRAASDFLLHFVKDGRRFIGEYHDGQLVWEQQDGKAVQANTYQILDLAAQDPEWTEDSEDRMADARRARGIPASLRAAENEYTADSIILIGKGAI